MGGKCALLGGGESRHKVLPFAEATLSVGGGCVAWGWQQMPYSGCVFRLMQCMVLVQYVLHLFL